MLAVLECIQANHNGKIEKPEVSEFCDGKDFDYENISYDFKVIILDILDELEYKQSNHMEIIENEPKENEFCDGKI